MRNGSTMRNGWLLAMVLAAGALALAGVGAAATPDSTDLKIAKSDSPDPVGVGASLAYTIQVQNLGPIAATGVVVTDPLPKGVDFTSAVSSQGSCTAKGKKVTCNLGGLGTPTIEYGGPPTMTITVIPRQVGTITNTASVDGAQKDPVASNDRATTTTRVVGPAAACRGVPATIVGTPGDDTIAGTGNPDVIVTFGGDDTVYALSGRDLVCAGSGSDRVGGGSAADRLFAGAGRDSLRGGGGPDVLKGGAGGDVLRGNSGADRLRGGSGADRCIGGAGADSIRGCER
jgi:uncharacterized repeat protein (TIGR01451 family)